MSLPDWQTASQWKNMLVIIQPVIADIFPLAIRIWKSNSYLNSIPVQQSGLEFEMKLHHNAL
jgi:hypothetical protein